MFDNILNWKLLAGSHDFPGPDGGTCINEAAIVAAGLEYQKVFDVDKMPSCFSRVISGTAMFLNDHFNEEDRQKLMKYVTKLVGTADTNQVEDVRRDLRNQIIFERMNHIYSPISVLHGVKPYTQFQYIMYRCVSWRQTYRAHEFEYVYQLCVETGLAVMDAILEVGNKAAQIEVELVQSRFENIKAKVAEKV